MLNFAASQLVPAQRKMAAINRAIELRLNGVEVHRDVPWRLSKATAIAEALLAAVERRDMKSSSGGSQSHSPNRKKAGDAKIAVGDGACLMRAEGLPCRRPEPPAVKPRGRTLLRSGGMTRSHVAV